MAQNTAIRAIPNMAPMRSQLVSQQGIAKNTTSTGLALASPSVGTFAPQANAPAINTAQHQIVPIQPRGYQPYLNNVVSERY